MKDENKQDPIDPNKPVVTPNADDKKDDKGGSDKLFNQAEVDKILSDRLAREREATNKTIAEEVAKAKEEERRLSKLSADEKEKETAKKQAEELANKEKNITLRENRADAIEKFTELKLPTKLVDFVVVEDKDSMKEKIDNFKKVWDESLNEAVAEKVKGETPKDPANNSNDKKGDFKGITSF